MARNPYAGLGGGSDPYTNGNGYGSSATSTPSITDDYDPYGERYGTPPIAAAASTQRDRRGARAGGYGGFYENSNGSAPTARPVAQQPQQPQQPQQHERYGGEGMDQPLPVRSPRRRGGSDQSRGYRERTDAEPSESNRGPDYRRGGDRRYQNGSGNINNM